ncbi:MAG: DMT family transporter [Anaerolineae bacterium]|nr:DMT family transporter [Anaerolineae bacterium]
MTSPAAPAAHPPNRVLFALIAAVFAGASAAIFTRLAQAEGAPSLLIAAFRLTLSALILTPIALTRHRREIADLLSPTRRADLGWAAFSALLMALHFSTWITSLEYTSVLIGTVLVTSSPLWTGVFESVFFRLRLSRGIIFGLLAGLAGNLVLTLSGSNGSGGSNMALGGALALIAAVAIALQRTFSRPLRQRLSLVPFLWLLFGLGGLALIVVLVFTQTPVTGFSPMGYFWMVMVTLFPQLIAHSAFNYALRYMPATHVSMLIQVQPIFSTAAAYLIFDEQPSLGQLAGGTIIVVGVFVAMLWHARDSARSGAAAAR